MTLRASLMICSLALVVLASMVMTEWFRRYALARRLIDVPNPRSSHAVATPRGGGIAIVVVTIIALPLLAASGELEWSSAWGLFGGGALVALIGHIDDRAHLEARYRLLAHFVAAAWLLMWVGVPSPLSVFGGSIHPGIATSVVAVLFLVWLLNLTNFMDGIDGIAAIETITVCVGGAVIAQAVQGGRGVTTLPLFVAAATAGFLRSNWPPAQIFLGDAGSGFLGLILGALSLLAAQVSSLLFWGWIILLGVFVVDATITLLVRLSHGEKPHGAHRAHAYQHAAQRLGSHKTVTLVAAGINVFWLLPIGLLVVTGHLGVPLGLLLGYFPLVVLALKLRAGLSAVTG
jgi:Fuc2NAc and GlcNAc transferase